MGQVGAAGDLGSCAGNNSLDLAADLAELPCGARPSARTGELHKTFSKQAHLREPCVVVQLVFAQGDELI